MRCTELFEQIAIQEDAEGDLAQHAEAEAAMHALADRLGRHNAATPLAKCPGFSIEDLGGLDVTMIRARTLGLAYDDLRIGFVSRMWVKAGTRGFLRTYGSGGRLEYYLVLVVDREPAEAVDLAWSVNWGVFIHEMVHYLDHARGYHRHTQRHLQRMLAGRTGATLALTSARRADYMNDDLETNAHFQQGLHAILARIVNLADLSRATVEPPSGAEMFPSFQAFDRKFRGDFPKFFWKLLNERNRRRFEKRFYALWSLCHDRWPDIDYIRHRLQALDATAARLAAQDATAQDATAEAATAEAAPQAV